MKKIEKLKIDDLSTRFVPLTEDEIAEIMGGWYCFSSCMDFISAGSGTRFMHYYDNMYGSAEAAGGVNSNYIESTLNSAGIGYTNYSNLGAVPTNGRSIIAINNGTHAVIYQGAQKADNGNINVSYIDPQTGLKGSYQFGKNESISVIGF